MAREGETERALQAITTALNDERVQELDSARAQEVVSSSLADGPHLTLDDGGGLHDHTGARVAAIRRIGSGEWIAERQNAAAERSHAAVPSPPPQSRLRSLLTRLKVLG